MGQGAGGKVEGADGRGQASGERETGQGGEVQGAIFSRSARFVLVPTYECKSQNAEQ